MTDEFTNLRPGEIRALGFRGPEDFLRQPNSGRRWHCQKASLCHFRAILWIGAMAVSLAWSATALAGMPSALSFSEVCPRFLAIADLFASDCLSNSRSKTRLFYPNGMARAEKEVHGTYFYDRPLQSHFGLGCTVNWKGKIDFLGVYYAVDPSDFNIANDADIRSIDFDGNVALQSDGRPFTLLAIQQFVTGSVAPRFHGRPQNCNVESSQEAPVTLLGGTFGFHEEAKGTSVSDLTICVTESSGKSTWCKTDEYHRFFPAPTAPVMFVALGRVVIIRESGEILIETEFLNKSCGAWYANRFEHANIAQELCTPK